MLIALREIENLGFDVNYVCCWPARGSTAFAMGPDQIVLNFNHAQPQLIFPKLRVLTAAAAA